MGKDELICPWCGTSFENERELEVHARKHYEKVTEPFPKCFA